MLIGPYKIGHLKFTGSLGGLGTIILLPVALMLITGLNRP